MAALPHTPRISISLQSNATTAGCATTDGGGSSSSPNTIGGSTEIPIPIRSRDSSKDAPFLVISRREALFCLLSLAMALSLLLLASAVRHGTILHPPDDSVRELRATGLRQLLAAPYDYHDDSAAAAAAAAALLVEQPRGGRGDSSTAALLVVERSAAEQPQGGAGSDDINSTKDFGQTSSRAELDHSTANPAAIPLNFPDENNDRGGDDDAPAKILTMMAAAANASRVPGSPPQASESVKAGPVDSESESESATGGTTRTGQEVSGGASSSDSGKVSTGSSISTPDGDSVTHTVLGTGWPLSEANPNLGGGGGGGARGCKRRSRTGHCVSNLFSLYDDVYRSLWPSRVDLVIRSYVSTTFFLLEMLFASIEQMWPRGIGDVILVLDADEQLAEDLIPTWVKVYYEENPLNLPGKILQQWSYLWADNYTTAPYVALIDDDVIFNMKVTPGLLFNLTDGKPYVIGSAQKQMNHWLPSTQFFVGKDKYFANFMVQLPFVMPTRVLPKFRNHVATVHRRKGESFDSVFKWFALHGPKFEKTQIAHTTIGNYMWAHAHDEVHWALEWTDHTPIPRVGVHLPYSQPFRVATNHKDNAPRVITTYVQLAAYYSHEGVCHALPAGELPGCDDVNKFPQRQIWQYAMDWYDWPAIKEKRANATVVYDQYQSEMACMYWRVAQAGGEGAASMQGTSVQLRGDAPAERRRRELVASLQDCITPRS
ncbi:hypothetical protein CLOM_g21056 [Closterium sp. NIES-68]|nr:hypothetical protein CLOM_g21056 [Closterium sp. NIES-68]GJP62579.1 hypothetical protein CLOP_g19626 [Closterium sp. NIES-67]